MAILTLAELLFAAKQADTFQSYLFVLVAESTILVYKKTLLKVEVLIQLLNSSKS